MKIHPKNCTWETLSTYEEDCSSRTSGFQLWSESTISMTFSVSCNMKAIKAKAKYSKCFKCSKSHCKHFYMTSLWHVAYIKCSIPEHWQYGLVQRAYQMLWLQRPGSYWTDLQFHYHWWCSSADQLLCLQCLVRWFAETRECWELSWRKRQSNYHAQGNLINCGPNTPSIIVDSQCR